MPWDEEKHNKDLKEHIQTLISLRNEHKVLANEGDLQFIPYHSDVVIYKRESDKALAYILINLAENSTEIPLEGKNKAALLYSDSQSSWNQESSTIKLAPGGYAILDTDK